MGQSKEPIRLRKRKTTTGLYSLYLDIYLNGKRSYEFLKLYLVPEKSREDKRKNQETLRLAETIRGKRLVELRNNEYGFSSRFKENINFVEYYTEMCNARVKTDSTGNWSIWNACLKHLLKYCPNLKQLTWRDIDKGFVQGFRDYLEKDDKQLTQNSKVAYFAKLRACCKKAYEEGVIAYNPARGVENIKKEEVKRMYLTVDELRTLAATECRHPSVKRAFLFSCLTGLRRSDIEKLKWKDVYTQGDFTRIIFTQKKTDGLEYLDLAPEAVELMGERGAPEESVFGWLHFPGLTNSTLREWCLYAGIKKHITFHSGRHTFAVMMLDLGADIYTVSKLLGHKDIATTQIYAKILDKKKQAAVAMIPSVLRG